MLANLSKVNSVKNQMDQIDKYMEEEYLQYFSTEQNEKYYVTLEELSEFFFDLKRKGFIETDLDVAYTVAYSHLYAWNSPLNIILVKDDQIVKSLNVNDIFSYQSFARNGGSLKREGMELLLQSINEYQREKEII